MIPILALSLWLTLSSRRITAKQPAFWIVFVIAGGAFVVGRFYGQ